MQNNVNNITHLIITLIIFIVMKLTAKFRLPEPPSISLREINELNAAFNSSFLNSSNQGRSDSKVLNLGRTH